MALNISIKTEFELANSPADITITDLDAYTGTGTFKHLLKIVSATYGVVYENTGYATDSYASPDMTTASPTVTGIALPTDASGDVVTGTYYVYSKVEFIGIATEYDTNTETYNFCYTAATISIDMEADCAASTLDVTDTTSYIVDCDGTNVTPSSTTRTMTIIYPQTILPTPPSNITTSLATYTVGPNIYTETWQVTVSTVLEYLLPCGLYVNDTVTGSDSLDVQCDDCQCNLLSCVDAVYNDYVSKRGTNPVKASELWDTLTRIIANWMMYSMAVRCGETDDAQTYCGAITTLVSSVTTCCTESTDATSQEITPVVGSGGSIVVGTTFYTDTGAPGSGLGANGDLYLNITNWDLYKKVTGSWVLQGNIAGAAGAAGASGGEVLEYNNLTAVITNTSETTLTNYTVAGGTLATNDDKISIRALVRMENGVNGVMRTVRLKLGGNTLMTVTDNGSAGYLRLELDLHRTGATSQIYDTVYERSLSPVERYISPGTLSETFTLASDLPILITGQVDVFSASTDLYTQSLEVIHFKAS